MKAVSKTPLLFKNDCTWQQSAEEREEHLLLVEVCSSEYNVWLLLIKHSQYSKQDIGRLLLSKISYNRIEACSRRDSSFIVEIYRTVSNSVMMVLPILFPRKLLKSRITMYVLVSGNTMLHHHCIYCNV